MKRVPEKTWAVWLDECRRVLREAARDDVRRPGGRVPEDRAAVRFAIGGPEDGEAVLFMLQVRWMDREQAVEMLQEFERLHGVAADVR